MFMGDVVAPARAVEHQFTAKGLKVDATRDGALPPGGRGARGKPRGGAHAPRNAGVAGNAGPRGGIPGQDCYGALDLGTNNCRLLLARPTSRGFVVVDAFSRIVRLGEGLGTSGHLKQAAMDRTIDALRVCNNKLKWHGVQRYRLVATEACRLAENGAEFIQRVEDETGLVLEIINRETEAALAAAGAEPLMGDDAQSAVIFDIGGGSTEVMWVERPQQGAVGEVKAWISLAAGVVTLSELHGGGRDVSHQQFEAMCGDVKRLMQPFVDQVKQLARAAEGPDHLLGTSGTVTTIAGVHLGLRHYDRSVVDGCWLESHEASRVAGQLRDMSYEERMRNGCIGRERADLVLAGCAILEEIRRAFPDKRIRVADRGLREGILSQLMKADGHVGRRL